MSSFWQKINKYKNSQSDVTFGGPNFITKNKETNM